jgi:hypothetical protein
MSNRIAAPKPFHVPNVEWFASTMSEAYRAYRIGIAAVLIDQSSR